MHFINVLKTLLFLWPLCSLMKRKNLFISALLIIHLLLRSYASISLKQRELQMCLYNIKFLNNCFTQLKILTLYISPSWQYISIYIYIYIYIYKHGPGSSVGIATELQAGRSGIESRCGRDFLAVQTGPGAHPASCKIGTGSFPGVKCGRGVLLTTHPLLVPRSRKSRAIPLPTIWATLGL